MLQEFEITQAQLDELQQVIITEREELGKMRRVCYRFIPVVTLNIEKGKLLEDSVTTFANCAICHDRMTELNLPVVCV
jgi:hypothetical protein